MLTVETKGAKLNVQFDMETLFMSWVLCLNVRKWQSEATACEGSSKFQ